MENKEMTFEEAVEIAEHAVKNGAPIQVKHGTFILKDEGYIEGKLQKFTKNMKKMDIFGEKGEFLYQAVKWWDNDSLVLSGIEVEGTDKHPCPYIKKGFSCYFNESKEEITCPIADKICKPYENV